MPAGNNTGTARTTQELLDLVADSQPAHYTNRQVIRDVIESLRATRELVISPKDAPYNAAGGGADDKLALQGVLDTLHTATGGTMVLPFDTYGSSGALSVYPNTRILFLGATLKALSALGTFISVPSRINCTFDGWGTVDGNNLVTSNLLDTTNADDLRVEGLSFKNGSGVSQCGLRLRGGKRARVRKCNFDTLTRGIYTSNNGSTPLIDPHFDDLYFTGMSDATIYNTGDASAASQGMKMSKIVGENFANLLTTRAGVYFISTGVPHFDITISEITLRGRNQEFAAGGQSDFVSLYDTENVSIDEFDISGGGDGGVVINRSKKVYVGEGRSYNHDTAALAIAGSSSDITVDGGHYYNSNQNYANVARSARGAIHIAEGSSHIAIGAAVRCFDDQAVKKQDYGLAVRSSCYDVRYSPQANFSGNKLGEVLDEGFGSSPLRRKYDRMQDATALPVLTIVAPNVAISARVRVRLQGALGAGGADGANESGRTDSYDIFIARTPGLAAVATLSSAFGGASSLVAGGATITLGAVVSAVNGVNTGPQTFTLNATITRGSGASNNHTCLVSAEVENLNPGADVTIDDTMSLNTDLITALGGDSQVTGFWDFHYGVGQDSNAVTEWRDIRSKAKATGVTITGTATRDADGTLSFNGTSNLLSSTDAALSAITGSCWCVIVCRGTSVTARREFELSVGTTGIILAGELSAATAWRGRGAIGTATATDSGALTTAPRIFHARRTSGVDVAAAIGSAAEVTAADATGDLTVTKFTLGATRAGASFSGMQGVRAVIIGKGVYTAGMVALINAWAQSTHGAVLTT